MPASLPSSTSGLVGDFNFLVLPSPPPSLCLSLVVLAQLPALIVLFRRPTPRLLTRCLVFAGMCTFMLGYHVHEKAVLVPLTVLALIACDDVAEAELFLQIAGAGIFGITPLLLGPAERVVKCKIVPSMN